MRGRWPGASRHLPSGRAELPVSGHVSWSPAPVQGRAQRLGDERQGRQLANGGACRGPGCTPRFPCLPRAPHPQRRRGNPHLRTSQGVHLVLGKDIGILGHAGGGCTEGRWGAALKAWMGSEGGWLSGCLSICPQVHSTASGPSGLPAVLGPVWPTLGSRGSWHSGLSQLRDSPRSPGRRPAVQPVGTRAWSPSPSTWPHFLLEGSPGQTTVQGIIPVRLPPASPKAARQMAPCAQPPVLALRPHPGDLHSWPPRGAHRDQVLILALPVGPEASPWVAGTGLPGPRPPPQHEAFWGPRCSVGRVPPWALCHLRPLVCFLEGGQEPER